MICQPDITRAAGRGFVLVKEDGFQKLTETRSLLILQRPDLGKFSPEIIFLAKFATRTDLVGLTSGRTLNCQRSFPKTQTAPFERAGCG